MSEQRSVAIVTLGCARNDVDSEEIAGRLSAAGWTLVDDAAQADVAVINTCGFIEQAKKDSIDTILEHADLKGQGRTQAVVAVGCMAQRYGTELEKALPEADAILGFDSYADLSTNLEHVLRGERPAAPTPGDRRQLLPLSPVARQAASAQVSLPGHGAVSSAQVGSSAAPMAPLYRVRLGEQPWAPLKIASGCDRRCAFCAIPAFRGAFVSRPLEQVVAEAQWLADQGVKEVLLVSENSTSYGKDLGNIRLLDELLVRLSEVEGLDVIRVSYLQPAEIRPDLLAVMHNTPKIAAYFDLSFQHASGPVLRRMRRFGSRQAFLDLISSIREANPEAGIRSNVIVGFPGETEADVEELQSFLAAAELDAVGVFRYSDEEGTEAEGYADKVPDDVVEARYQATQRIAEAAMDVRSERRVGQQVRVLVEEAGQVPCYDSADDAIDEPWGRAAHQGPEVDGVCSLVASLDSAPLTVSVGQWVEGVVVESNGPDLVVEVR